MERTRLVHLCIFKRLGIFDGLTFSFREGFRAKNETDIAVKWETPRDARVRTMLTQGTAP